MSNIQRIRQELSWKLQQVQSQYPDSYWIKLIMLMNTDTYEISLEDCAVPSDDPLGYWIHRYICN